MQRHLISLAGACFMTLSTSGTAHAHEPAGESRRADPREEARPVACLELSPRLLGPRFRPNLTLLELNAIWEPLGWRIRWAEPRSGHCDLDIAVKDETEAPSGERPTTKAALGWVRFVNGHAQHVVFLRMARLPVVIGPFRQDASVGSSQFIGRLLAHELGHVILDKRDHDDRGLMQRRHPSDVLRVPSSAYTLTDADRARLASRFASGPTSDPY